MTEATFTESNLLDALRLRHSDALFVGGCKSGPTQSPRERLRILDAWVLLRTWSPVTTIGYEVKVSRSDWIGDQKFQEYLSLCHQLYVVAPKGLVLPQELPSQVGLLEALRGGRLVTRVKAPHREIVLPENLVVYVLMARVREKSEDASDRLEHWRSWLADKREGGRLGYLVHQKIQDKFNDLRRKTQQAEAEAFRLKSIHDWLVAQGYDPAKPVSRREIEQHLSCLNLDRELTQIQAAVDRLRALGVRQTGDARLSKLHKDAAAECNNGDESPLSGAAPADRDAPAAADGGAPRRPQSDGRLDLCGAARDPESDRHVFPRRGRAPATCARG